MARKQVLMQLNDDLVADLDLLVQRTGRNRSDLAREALASLLERYRQDDIDRQYVHAYSTTPADDALDAWSDAVAIAALAALDAEDGGW